MSAAADHQIPAGALLATATEPRGGGQDDRMLVVDPASRRFGDERVGALERLLVPGDVVVLNDAATLPASLFGRTEAGPVEVRICGFDRTDRFRAVLLGAGDWRTPTELRPAPHALKAGERIEFASDLEGTIDAVDPLSPRLVWLRFDRREASLWSALYRLGRPIQYAYMHAPLDLWSVQNAYACRPWAVERPSAGRPLSIPLLVSLRRRGVRVATITHAAGLSSTGDAAIDAALPLPERFEVPDGTRAVIEEARREGHRVVAVGTSVVRALESAVGADGRMRSGEGEATLVIGADCGVSIVDGLLTGLHEPATSHGLLLQAFVSPTVLQSAYNHAACAGYLGHEYGDVCLVLARAFPE